MFSGAALFNQAIGSWDVLNVKDFVSTSVTVESLSNFSPLFFSKQSVFFCLDILQSFMFNSTSFNEDIGSWNVSNAEGMVSSK